MEKELIKGNLHRIIAIAERMHLPASAERIVELARNTEHIVDRMDRESIQNGLIVSSLAESVTPGAGESIRITDPNLFRWAARASLEKHPKEPR